MANPIRPKASNRTYGQVTIQSGATDGASEIINITGLTLSSIQVTTEGWTAASIGFDGNVDGSTKYLPIFGSDGEYLTLPATANRLIAFSPAQFAGLQVIRLVSRTTAGVAVQQAADRTLKLGLF